MPRTEKHWLHETSQGREIPRDPLPAPPGEIHSQRLEEKKHLLKENESLLLREVCLGGQRDQEAITAKVRMVERRQGAGEGRAQEPGPCAPPRAAPVPSSPMLLRGAAPGSPSRPCGALCTPAPRSVRRIINAPRGCLQFGATVSQWL